MAARGRAEGPDGLAVIDKARDWTSHDVVAKARGLLGTRKVGHSGTLDPDATGVLLLGAGRVTRLLRFLGGLRKRYTGVVVLGTATSTLDAAGEVTGAWDMSSLNRADMQAAAEGLTGAIEQVPPMVSAVQIGGRRLHQLARQGIEVEREPRPVNVYSFSVGEAVEPGCFPIEVECSSGTYIRVLAADLGTRARRRCSPARSASHRDRFVQRRRGRAHRRALRGPPPHAGRSAARSAAGAGRRRRSPPR